MNANILIVDDEPEIRNSISEVLSEENYNCTTAANGEIAIQLISENNYDLIISDIKMPIRDGMDILRHCRIVSAQTAVIIITAYATVETAIEALRQGAVDYILKPMDFDELVLRVKNIIKGRKTILENSWLRNEVQKKYNYSHIIGESAAIKEVFHLVSRVAPSTSNVIITGKSGTGKELVARAIHQQSSREKEAFIAINCGAIPENLFESELFGYKKGAFTGANQDKDGVFKAASGGTLFLDEVGEIPIHTQVKLLRAIESKEIKPLGSANISKINVRIVSATNRDLMKEVEEGNFREDLYYRLNIVEIPLPSLSERQEDIPLLVNFFIDKYNKELKRKIMGVDNEAMRSLINYNWKGEVRELENIIERAVLLTDNNYLTINDIPGGHTKSIGMNYPDNLKDATRLFEKNHIKNILNRFENDKSKAAEAMEIGLSSLYRKIDDLAIEG
ncbi:MAG: sigma-54-dependent Fis family transcriptional regulator [Candidatus Marinimicrobia bacterium]|nr:sigma-54-dependent Fis family transcriptional regulator [Candidatus Neomarinimicrobiota bacterium]